MMASTYSRLRTAHKTSNESWSIASDLFRGDRPMNGIRSSRWLMMAFFAIATFASVHSDAGERKPNFLVILCDDVGWAEFGFQGGKDIPTPHIDSIAKNGVRFTQGYVSGPYCSPARAGLMTGRYQTRFGHEFNSVARDSGIPDTEQTMAQRLKPLGYVTIAIGKWHLGSPPEYRPMKK